MGRLLETMVREIAFEGSLDIRWAPEYAEPGYTAGDSGVYFANWNTRSKYDADGNRTEIRTAECRIGKVLEHLGVELEWNDEWSTCEDCNRAVRTSGDSYSWTPHYVLLNECEIVCADCMQTDPEAYIEHLANNANTADTFNFDFAAHGFEQANGEHESGWHPGQDADPHAILKELSETGRQIIFQISGVGQFDTRWIVWMRDLEGEN